VSPEASLELILGEGLDIGMGVAISLPPSCCGSKQLVCREKNLFTVGTLCLSTDFSQSSASMGSVACEKVLERVLRNLPSLDWGGGGGACCCCVTHQNSKF
jgi:hypothetical protein